VQAHHAFREPALTPHLAFSRLVPIADLCPPLHLEVAELMKTASRNASEIVIPLGRELCVRLSKFPTLFESPVSYIDPVAGQEIQPIDEYGPEVREAGDIE
jgi:hypothetical protein